MTHIRRMQRSDAKTLANIWLEASLVAHHFVSKQYWIANRAAMEELYLIRSEVFLAEENNNSAGFIALDENHIAALFVAPASQRRGIGSTLIDYAKSIRNELTLNVYQKNEDSFRFYLKKSFDVIAETVDHDTGEKEYKMYWNTDSAKLKLPK